MPVDLVRIKWDNAWKVLFLNCKKHNIKFTILTIFKCTVQ